LVCGRDFGIEDIEIQMDVHPFYMLSDCTQCPRQFGSNLTWPDDVDAGLRDQSALERIHVTSADEANPFVRDGLESGDAHGELFPASASNDCNRCPVQESAGSRLGGIEIAVRIEPRHAQISAKPGERSDGGVAVAGENDWKTAGFTRIEDGGREHPHQLEARLNLRVPRIGGQLRDFGMYAMAIVSECLLEAGREECFRAGAHSRPEITGIVRHREELDVHGAKLTAVFKTANEDYLPGAVRGAVVGSEQNLFAG
jgi:hypothetical protein